MTGSTAMGSLAGDSPPVVTLNGWAAERESLERFFAHASPNGYAYIVAPDSDAATLTVDEVTRITGVQAVRVIEGMAVEADRIHLVRPGLEMTVVDGYLVATSPPAPPPSPAESAAKPAPTLISFQQIAEATPAMMWSVGPDGTTWRNRGMREWLGLAAGENPYWLGEAAARFIYPEDKDRIAGAVRGVLNSGESWSGEYRLRRADGQYRWVAVRINALDLDDGSIHSIGVVEDIDDRLALERSLRDMNRDLENRVAERTAELADRNERLRRRNEVLDQFAHAASHDLRAPLRTIRSYIGLLEEELAEGGGEPLSVSDLTERIGSAAVRMQRLLEALLRYASVGRRDLDVHPVDPTESVREAVEDLNADLQATGARVVVEELPPVLGDGAALTEVFNNLLSNAVRYRSDHAPHVTIRGARSGDAVRIEVTDNGRGFEPRFATAVFEPFRRLSNIDESGTGLGLAICARIIERLGGRIEAASSPGEGTTITMELRGTDG